jgi:hypothetical protein
MQITAKDYKQAMDDLRKGKITPDQFRAISRASREQNGQAAHDQIALNLRDDAAVQGLNVRVEALWEKVARLEEMAGL